MSNNLKKGRLYVGNIILLNKNNHFNWTIFCKDRHVALTLGLSILNMYKVLQNLNMFSLKINESNQSSQAGFNFFQLNSC